MSPSFTPSQIQRYEKGGYRFLGKNKHSAIQVCRWAKSSLRGKRDCYKKIFGITSHRCIQISPTLNYCPFSCEFCWRTFKEKNFNRKKQWDSPKEIVQDAIKQQKTYLAGFGGSKYTTEKRLKEALTPNHFAISLDGEPTIYPHLPELIKEIKAKGNTVFLVTNGVFPNKIKELYKKNAIPDNLSLSIYATNPKDYQTVTKSFIPFPLNKIKQSLKLMRLFKNTRTNVRLTLVKDLNLKDPKGYAKLILLAKPKFITLKGYSFLGASAKKLKITNMPTMQEIEDFANSLSKHTKYIQFYKDRISRVIILIKDKSVIKFNKKKIKEQKQRYKTVFLN